MTVKDVYKNIIFSLTVIVSFFLIAELISQCVYYLSTSNLNQNEGAPISDKPYFIDHPTLGWIPSPGYDGFREGHKGKLYHCKVNSVGMRDREIPPVKSPNIIRIFCLGDSITEGPNVDNEETYPKLLEKILNKSSTNKKFEVYNCGVGDYSIAQEVIFLRDIVLKFKPDIVILGYFLNDGRGFVPNKTITIRTPLLKNIFSRSKFIFYLNKIILKYRLKFQWKLWNKYRFRWKELYKTNKWKDNKDELYKLIKSADCDWGTAWTQRGWNNVKKNMNYLLKIKNKYSFELLVVNFPVVIQIYSKHSNEDHIHQPQIQMQKYCQEHNITYIDLIHYLKKYPIEYLFTDHCHLTSDGLKVVANIIAPYILR